MLQEIWIWEILFIIVKAAGLFSNLCKKETLQRMMSYEFSNRLQSSHFWDTSRLMFQAAALNVYVENYATSNSNYICVTNNITGRGNRN